jgi:hypothetical protein
VRRGQVFRSDWSLYLHFMLGWLVFVLLIEQLHALRSRQVLSLVGGDL